MPGPTATAGVVGVGVRWREIEPPRQWSRSAGVGWLPKTPQSPLVQGGTPLSLNVAPQSGKQNYSLDYCFSLVEERLSADSSPPLDPAYYPPG